MKNLSPIQPSQMLTPLGDLLQDVASGDACNYGTAAAAIGHASAVHAVGAAISRNPMSLVLPCHRVIGHNGGFIGEACGLELNTVLLALEQRVSAIVPLTCGATA